MPFYKWTGINLLGDKLIGTKFAKSAEDLDILLLKEAIGLLSYKKERQLFTYISNSEKLDFLNQLSSLLSAEIRLYESLSIVQNSLQNKKLKLIIYNIAESVNSGMSLSNAIIGHDYLFDQLAQAIIISGEQSGDLKKSLNLFVEHKKQMEKFSQEVKSNLTMPFITLILFIFVTIIIFLFVIPRFEILYQSFKEPLPNITVLVLRISKTIRSLKFFVKTIIFFFIATIFYKIINIKYKTFIDQITLKIPYIGPLLILFYKAKFLHIINLLLKGQIRLAESLIISSKLFDNMVISNDIFELYKLINAGKLFSTGLKNSIFYSDQLYGLVKIAESSGEFTNIMKYCSEIYQQKAYKNITKLTILLGPLFIILIGLLISGLILAIYIPIISLGNIIDN